MAATYTSLPLDGSTREFTIPFEYLTRRFIVITLIGATRKTLNLTTDYRFVTPTKISTNVAWGQADGYDYIELRRTSSATDRLVDFNDGSILRASDLNISQVQAIHIAEEARDISSNALLNNQIYWDALNLRLHNVADPTEAQDATNKRYVDSLIDQGIGRTLRVPVGESIVGLPAASLRASKVLAFDSLGQPITTAPVSGSSVELAIDLADPISESKGAALIGYRGSSVRGALDNTVSKEELEHNGTNMVLYKNAGAKSVTRSLGSKLDEWVSIKDFGAVCDGSTNDSAAVQDAVDYCLSFDPPKTLVVPGIAYLSSPVRIERPVDSTNSQTFFTVQGVGDGGFMCDSTVMFTAYPSSTNWMPESQKIRFQDLVFKQSHWSYDGFVLEGRRFLAIDFNNCSFLKIRVADTETYLQTWYFNNCSAFNYYGWLLRSTGGAYDVHWNMCKVQASQSFNGINGGFLSLTNEWAIHSADPVTGCSVSNSHIQAMAGTAIECDRVQGVSFIGSYFELNGSVDILFATAGNQNGRSGVSRGACVIGCTFGSTASNLLDPNWRPIQWGKMSGGYAAGNAYPNGGGAKLHGLLPGGVSKVFLNGEPGIDGLYVTEWITADGGYVQPGIGGERLKSLRGTVGSTGSKDQGGGFISSRTGVGTYLITFSTPFSSPPSFSASAADTTGDSVSVKYITLSANEVSVRARVGGSAADCEFSFNITGPV